MVGIFDPMKIGKKEVKNRVMFAPTMSNFASADGSVSDQLVAYLENVASGEVGTIVTGHAFIDDIASKGYRYMLGCHKPGLGLERIPHAVKKYDCTCLIQLNHIGPKADPKITNGTPRGPINTISHFRETPNKVQMLTIDEIEEIVRAYGRAAARAEEAGFDGVEVHGAHNYLISSFISPVYNTRHDSYGSDFEGRLRFALEVLAAIKANVSNNFLVGIRFNGAELLPRGLPLEDGIKVGQAFEKAGVDYLNVSQTSTVRKASIATTFDRPGQFTYIPAAVKGKVRLPVVGVGGLHRVEDIERVLHLGLMDIVAICRGFIADPHLVKKIKEKRQDEQRLCLRCDLCLFRTWKGTALRCSINSMMGKESERDLNPVPKEKRKQVLVVGGGVAGMEAAWLAAKKGHDVVLYEMDDRLGGQVRAASTVEYMDTFATLVRCYEVRLARAGVKIYLNHKISEAEINQLRPDVVIVATGAKETFSHIPGTESNRVRTGLSALLDQAKISGQVAVVGATMIGCEVALQLSIKGCTVRLISKHKETDFGSGLQFDVVQNALLERLKENSVQFHPESQVAEIRENTILLMDDSGAFQEIDADHIVFAGKMVATKTVDQRLLNHGIQVLKVGDCVKPKSVYVAIQQAANAVFGLTADHRQTSDRHRARQAAG